MDPPVRHVLHLGASGALLIIILGILLFVQEVAPLTVIVSYLIFGALYLTVCWIGLAGDDDEW